MDERVSKLALYFLGAGAYWKLSDNRNGLAVDPGPIGPYPLDMVPRLASGHFTCFDEAGLPVRYAADKRTPLHNYTTICCFALAHWESYLKTGEKMHLERFLCAADYIVRTADRQSGIVRLRAERPGAGHTGEVSSIVQGEAISVLCRAWQATQKSHYLETAVGCLGPFDLSIAEGGVVGCISSMNLPWYEEYPAVRPLQHVLNGMIYAIWGLRELAVVSGISHAKELFDRGVNSIHRALPSFDNGFWSLYALPEEGRPYVASMMYHGLHICQLTALGLQTSRPEFCEWALRFENYSHSAMSRICAASWMIRAKLSGK
jgi:heparosan-N-sulfate-glucuronate 5-epimerase